MEEMQESNFYISSMGIETVKQFNAAANLLQGWQFRMMFGDKTIPAITTDPNVKGVSVSTFWLLGCRPGLCRYSYVIVSMSTCAHEWQLLSPSPR